LAGVSRAQFRGPGTGNRRATGRGHPDTTKAIKMKIKSLSDKY